MNENFAPSAEGAEREALLWLQEAISAEAAEQEDVWNWIQGIGSGAAQGAATGLAAGPWGALIGGLVGAGLGAVQTAVQQQQPAVAHRPAQPPPAARPPATPPPSARPQPAAPPIDPQLLQQVAQLLPQLIQLLSRQSPGGAREEIEGDLVPDEAFISEAERHEAIVEAGIEGPIPEVWEHLPENALPEYPQATRFVPAAAGNYRVWHESSPRPIRRIVIHITDGGTSINGPISWFQNPAAGVSAHYIVGQDGEVVQMVRHNDVAYHAGSANGDTIGIEHVANTRGLNPTDMQYCSSAALVNWLCTQYGIPMDRVHILGHSEADSNTTHRACPNAVWNWDYYMRMVTSGACFPQSAMREDVETAAEAPEAAPESMPSQRWLPYEVVLDYPAEWATEAVITEFSTLVH